MYTLYHFELQEKEALETFLNQKSESGYELQWFNGLVFHFHKTNKQKYYYVDYNPNLKNPGVRYLDESQQKQIEFYESSGYHFECNYQYFMVYSSNIPLAPIHTDSVIEQQIIQKTKYSLLKTIIFPFLLIAYLFFMILSSPDFILHLASNNSFLLLVGISLFTTICYIPYAKFIEKQIKKGNHTLHYIQQRTWVTLFLDLLSPILLLLLFYLHTQKIALVVLFLVLFLIVHIYQFFLSRTMSHASSTKRNLITAFIVIVMFTCTYGVLSTIQKFQTPLKKDATVNVLSESITGKITHIHHAEKVDSFLLHQISCSFQTESDNFFKYDYYQSKNSFITSTILKTMNKYINIEPYKVLNAIEIYHSLNYTEDEMDQLSKPGESYYIMNPYFLLLKNNDEIIQLHSSHPINDEMILTIISDLNW